MLPGKVICPTCFSSVNVKRYGDGWVGICCGEIIYNSNRQPYYISATRGACSTDSEGSNHFVPMQSASVLCIDYKVEELIINVEKYL